MSTPELIIAVTFVDSQYFNNTMRLISGETQEITIYFHPNDFEISFTNDLETAAHYITFDASELIEYIYMPTDVDGELMEEYSLTFKVNELFKIIDGIGRHSTVRLYHCSDSNHIVVNSNTVVDGQTDHIVNLKPKAIAPVDFSDFIDDEHSCKMSAAQLHATFNSAIKRKCASIEISFNEEDDCGDDIQFLRFLGYAKDGSVAFTKEWVVNGSRVAIGIEQKQIRLRKVLSDAVAKSSSKTSEETESSTSVRIPLATVKSLCKMDSVSAFGNLLCFYFKEGKPVRISNRIGTIGMYNVILRSPQNKKTSRK